MRQADGITSLQIQQQSQPNSGSILIPTNPQQQMIFSSHQQQQQAQQNFMRLNPIQMEDTTLKSRNYYYMY